MAGVFGPTGREVFQQLQRQRAQEAAQVGQVFGGMSPSQVSQAAFAQGGAMLGGAVEQAISPMPFQVRQADARNAAMARVQASGVDPADPIAFADALADAFAAEGLVEEAREAGLEADKARNRQAERDNALSLIQSRLSAQAKREEAELDRASRERIAAMRAQRTGTTPKSKVQRAATGTDVKQAEPVIRDIIGDELLDEVDNAEDMVRWVAQRAKNLATETPGTDFQVAQEQAVEEAQTLLRRKKAILGFQDIAGRADFVFDPNPDAGSKSAAALGGGAPARSEQSQADAALAWARANPDDPRAAQILTRLGQ